MIPGLITHLEANTESFQTIKHAWTLKPVVEMSEIVPAVFLWSGPRSAASELATTCPRQQITKRINAFIVCEPVDFESIWLELWDAMVGYQVDAQYEPLAYADGDIQDVSGKYLWWRDSYQTKRQHTKGG